MSTEPSLQSSISRLRVWITKRLGGLYAFEWVAILSVAAIWMFFLASPVTTDFFGLVLMTAWTMARIAGLSLALILVVRGFLSIRMGSGLNEFLRSSELSGVRFWTDLVRILVSFSLVETSHLILKVYIPVINPSNHDALFYTLDRAIFFGHDPVRAVLEFFTSPVSLRLIDAVYSGFYYFFLWGGVVIFLAVFEGRRRIAFFSSFMMMWQLGLLLYVLLPSWGPVYIRPDEWVPALKCMPVTVHVQSVLHEETRSIVMGHYNLVIRYFGLAAFPSLHVGVFVLYSLWARLLNRPYFWCNVVMVALIFIGSMVTGYHYFVDGLGGALVAVTVFAAARKLESSAHDPAVGE